MAGRRCSPRTHVCGFMLGHLGVVQAYLLAIYFIFTLRVREIDYTTHGHRRTFKPLRAASLEALSSHRGGQTRRGCFQTEIAHSPTTLSTPIGSRCPNTLYVVQMCRFADSVMCVCVQMWWCACACARVCVNVRVCVYVGMSTSVLMYGACEIVCRQYTRRLHPLRINHHTHAHTAVPCPGLGRPGQIRVCNPRHGEDLPP